MWYLVSQVHDLFTNPASAPANFYRLDNSFCDNIKNKCNIRK